MSTLEIDVTLVSERSGDFSFSATEEKKEKWLQLHDRHTSGIPGLFPAVIGLPIRFTESIDKSSREQGVFKHSRGILVGMKLFDKERARLEELVDNEVVLKQRPAELMIEVPTATKKMPRIDGRPIYVLKVQRKTWSLDKEGNIKILRCGFPVVPDFGGTAHVVCFMETLSAKPHRTEDRSGGQSPNSQHSTSTNQIKIEIEEYPSLDYHTLSINWRQIFQWAWGR